MHSALSTEWLGWAAISCELYDARAQAPFLQVFGNKLLQSIPLRGRNVQFEVLAVADTISQFTYLLFLVSFSVNTADHWRYQKSSFIFYQKFQ